LYKELYIIGSKLSKRDKLGLHSRIERICGDILAQSIKASLASKVEKGLVIQEMRINIETLKYLIRISFELGIIIEKKYIALEESLQEISKMATGWEKYATNNPGSTPRLL
jgi:hypothetical protein